MSKRIYSRSIKKYIRKAKALIRAEVSDIQEQNKRIQKLYASLKPRK